MVFPLPVPTGWKYDEKYLNKIGISILARVNWLVRSTNFILQLWYFYRPCTLAGNKAIEQK